MALNVIDYSDRQLVLLGDVHGEFGTLKSIIKSNLSLKNPPAKGSKTPSISLKSNRPKTDFTTHAVLVVCGDCGFGFNKPAYYEMELKELQNLLEESDLILLWLRGNHDDPDYFQTIDGKFNFNNIKFIPDYTVLKTLESTSLCIGGAVSHDRSWRLKENMRLNRYKRSFKRLVYWDNETVQKNDDMLSELKETGLTVDSIIAHTIPTDFLKNDILEGFINNEWYKTDKTVSEDIEKENQILTDLLIDLVNAGNDIKWWSCGHLHIGHSDIVKLKIKNPASTENVMDFSLPIFTLNMSSRWLSPELSHQLGFGVLDFAAIKRYLKNAQEETANIISPSSYSLKSNIISDSVLDIDYWDDWDGLQIQDIERDLIAEDHGGEDLPQQDLLQDEIVPPVDDIEDELDEDENIIRQEIVNELANRLPLLQFEELTEAENEEIELARLHYEDPNVPLTLLDEWLTLAEEILARNRINVNAAPPF